MVTEGHVVLFVEGDTRLLVLADRMSCEWVMPNGNYVPASV